MNILKKFFLIILLYLFVTNISYAENIYFIDFTKVLNQSIAGADAQNRLKNRFESESAKYKKQEENIKKEESNLITLRKTMSEDEYKKRLNELRKKVSDFQANQQTSLSDIAKARIIAKQELLKNLNPILKRYMEDNKIRIIVDKQSVVLGDTTLEVTDKIIELLNKEIKSIKLN